MSKIHPRETELAGFSDQSDSEDADGRLAEHVRWCARCRSAVAEYRWLEGEVEATLTAAADAIAVSRPEWRTVRERLFTLQRRRVVGGRVSAVAGVALAFCLMLTISPVLGPAAAGRTLSPDAFFARAPLTAAASDEHGVTLQYEGKRSGTFQYEGKRSGTLVTPTPAISWAGETPSLSKGADGTPSLSKAPLAPTPAYVLPPTPPQPDY